MSPGEPSAAAREPAIAAVRRFSRFYTRQLGLLEERLLHSAYSLAEARVIYEVAQHESTTATALVAELGLDAGYVSRILRRLQKRGVLARRRSITDARHNLVSLTEAGRSAFAELDAASSREIGTLLEGLAPDERGRLVAAMHRIESLLGGDGSEPKVPYILRPPEPGDLGWVVSRHGTLYAREYGWDERFEGLSARVIADFVRTYDAKRERCWIAEREGENVGSVFCVKKSATVAQLRLLLVEPKARGLGIGKRLVEECVGFARRVGYRKLTLWTNDNLHAARRIYEQRGFQLVHREPHAMFGEGLVGETWELKL